MYDCFFKIIKERLSRLSTSNKLATFDDLEFAESYQYRPDGQTQV